MAAEISQELALLGISAEANSLAVVVYGDEGERRGFANSGNCSPRNTRCPGVVCRIGGKEGRRQARR